MKTRYALAVGLVPVMATLALAQAPAPQLPAELPPTTSPPKPGLEDGTPPMPDSSSSDASVSASSEEPPGADLAPPSDTPAMGLGGSIGLLRLSAPDVGDVGQVRVGISGEWFDSSDFVIKGDQNMRLGGALSVGLTPLRFLELFGSISGSANRNRRTLGETDRTDPEVIKAYGDLTLGTKLAYPIAGGVSAGGELGMRLFSSVSGISFDGGATSIWLSALGGWDLRKGAGIPVRTMLNVGLYFDNSDEVQDFRGVSRASKAVSQFAYGIGRDRVRTGLGFEWLIDDVTDGLGLRPFAEYHLDYITADADPAFDDYTPPKCRGSSPSAGSIECRDNRDQQWITFGMRAVHRSGFSVGAGVDISVSSVGFPYGSPVAPYTIMLAVGHTLDFGAPRVVTKVVTVEKLVPMERKAEAREGIVAGKVMSAAGGAPIEGAVVGVAGRPRSRVATDPDGTFRTQSLPSGQVELEVNAPGFEPARLNADVITGQEAALTVTLNPRDQKTKVSGKVTDEAGKPVPAAMVRFTGPQNAEAKADDAGGFSTVLPPGAYVVRVESDRHFVRESKVTLESGKEAELSTQVRAKPAVSRVSIANNRVVVRQGVSFKGASARAPGELTPAAQGVLDELADALLHHPEVRRLRIEAHWDGGLAKETADDVTQQQARLIVAHLAKAGVPEGRLQAVGMGAQRPIVPNIGPAKMRNRRVEFHIAN